MGRKEGRGRRRGEMRNTLLKSGQATELALSEMLGEKKGEFRKHCPPSLE